MMVPSPVMVIPVVIEIYAEDKRIIPVERIIPPVESIVKVWGISPVKMTVINRITEVISNGESRSIAINAYTQ
jgi:hypothetical protein